jgi:drug/metabolite transporter (DMT)-like permease
MTDRNRQILGIIAIVVGIAFIIRPDLIGYIAGIILIIYGALEIIR